MKKILKKKVKMIQTQMKTKVAKIFCQKKKNAKKKKKFRKIKI